MWSDSGLVNLALGLFGLQILGKPFGEEKILCIAHAYERSTSWNTDKLTL
jgi:Asp-tRNA(Asn)/Glu-tRNA(Gln) amidotransferase A subunit family amidase